jgi:uncharacterized membrane protein YfcA
MAVFSSDQFQLWEVPLLFGTGLVAGFVDSIAGGGGLITLPVMLSLGGDPQYALGTNKLQATFGSASAAWHYAEAGAVDLRACWRACVFTFLGAIVGTLGVRQIGPDALKVIIPLLLLAVAVYSLRNPRLGEADGQPRMSRVRFDLIFGLSLGFYDGFFGPGTGTFWTMAFVLMLGFNLTRATGYTKAVNFSSNLCSLLVFALAGRVNYVAGTTMGVGQLLGARFGSRMVMARGTNFIRPVFITVVLLLTGKLLCDTYFK